MSKNYKIVIPHEFNENLEKNNSNVDVWVEFTNGQKFTATFFTLSNIKELMEKFKKTQECKSGLYFYASNMIIVQEVTMRIINETIEDLILQNEFNEIFTSIA
jgi:hypothetical protein